MATKKTTTRRTTRSTTAAPKPIAATRTTAAAETNAPATDTRPPADVPIADQPEMKKRELIQRAVERSGVKRRDAKPAIEAALAVLGEALAEGRSLNLAPMGKVKVNRIKAIGGGGKVIVSKVRQPGKPMTPGSVETDDLAEMPEPPVKAAE
ncbi:HU family DNA-binding protein [Thalassococcus sp. CAU 1522]|uniref:HU family DNA-binding protein n=1 Tax=Thalassococcus arenae TaxID=2851652 RepID=A0ABS6N9A1_9RHOB|nr:HU family DNA-binding protein [Thalassococcus arenae]MBV2360592.1 HU family DNA-binding protein [Thalassococcus arenae]